MFKAFSTRKDRIRSFILLGLCAVFAAAAAIIGISDNLPGILLAFLSACALILAFIHHWRRSRQYLFFLLGSLGAFVLFVVLHNVFEAIGTKMDGSGFLYGLVSGINVVSFFIAVMGCPVGILVGLVGMLIFLTREDKTKPSGAKDK